MADETAGASPAPKESNPEADASADAKTDTAAEDAPYEPHPDEETIKESVIGVMRSIYDPEIPVNIYDIGLIYDIRVDTDAKAWIKMTLTSPMCPVAGSLPPEVEQKAAGAAGVRECNVELVWEPPWGPHLLSEAARLQLNL